jgi:YfiH family protein
VQKAVLVVVYVKTNDWSGVLVERFILNYGNNGLWYGTFTHLNTLNIKHGISSRLGGTSKQPFSSLNLGMHVEDNIKDVITNRQLFCEAIGMRSDHIVTAQQLHTDTVAVVTTESIGKGAQNYSEAIGATDALITNVSNIPLMLFFADCVPVLIVDPVQKAVGVVHAGWKGTVAKIAQKTILAMQANFSTTPRDCLVAIAPSIGPCCYIVDEFVVNKLKKQFDNWEELVRPTGDKWYFDLWKANCMQLEQIGVKSSNIVVSGVCTACNHELFFSYRKENGCTGRMGAAIIL